MLQRHFCLRLPSFAVRFGLCYAHNLPHDPTGLLEKGRAEENIYFRKKEREELLRMRRKLDRLERTQQQLEDKLEKAQEIIDELKESKDKENNTTFKNSK
ncbi:uncharacterized protein LOC142240507 [Haematobia irritans]|uniref:uncharacterized protein LOC142240507 n=1 Tax=Haematobia irritans TaxID=7368 RepID=UPI003F4FED3A